MVWLRDDRHGPIAISPGRAAGACRMIDGESPAPRSSQPGSASFSAVAARQARARCLVSTNHGWPSRQCGKGNVQRKLYRAVYSGWITDALGVGVCSWLTTPREDALLRRRPEVSPPRRSVLADHRGTAIVEFSFIAPLFLFVLFLIFEIGLALFTQQNLDNAARQAARLIRAGTITGKDYSSDLTAAICGNVVLVPACESTIQVYVAAEPSGNPAGAGFSAISTATVTDGAMTPSLAPLGSDYAVILEIGYRPPWAAGLITALVGGNADLLLSTMVFETEVY